MLTKQKLFDTVATHLLRQGRKALNPGSGCKYVAADGARCAIGCLVPREVYTPAMEGKNLRNILDSNSPELKPAKEFFKNLAWNDDDMPILCDLQTVHDNGEVSNWRESLKQVAMKHKIDPAVVVELR